MAFALQQQQQQQTQQQDPYRDSLQSSSAYSDSSSYYDRSPLDSLLQHYPPVPGASSISGSPKIGMSNGRIGTSPLRDETYPNHDSPLLHTQFRADSATNYSTSPGSSRGASPTSQPGTAPLVINKAPLTSVVPPTPTNFDNLDPMSKATPNAGHLSAISAASNYSTHDSWISSPSEPGESEGGGVRETWRSSASAPDPFTFRRFEAPRVEPPKLIVHSPEFDAPETPTAATAPTNFAYAPPTPELQAPGPVGRVPSKVPVQYNFSRPIRANPSTTNVGSTLEQPEETDLAYLSDNGEDDQDVNAYRYTQDTFSTTPANLPKTTPSQMYGDDNFMPSSPSSMGGSRSLNHSPQQSPVLKSMESFSSQARSPSPMSLNSGETSGSLFYKRKELNGSGLLPVQNPQNLSPTNLVPQKTAWNSQPDHNNMQTPTTSEGGRPVIALSRSPPPMRAGSSTSIYSSYSFYDLPASGTTTPIGNKHDSPVESTSRTPTPTQRTAPTTFEPPSSISSHGHGQPPPHGYGHGRGHQQEATDIENPRTPHDFLALGIIHHESNRLSDSAICFEKAATINGGCGVGMLMWGLSLRHAWGCEKDEKSAFRWLRKAAECAVDDMEKAKDNGDRKAVKSELVLAIYEVGQCFFHGWGVEQDKKMAVSYFQVAARLGDCDAQLELGFCFANGKGCKKDLKEAAKWYRAAAEQGASTVGLAWIYKPKYGGGQTDEKASRPSTSSITSRSKSPLSRFLSPDGGMGHDSRSMHSGQSTGPRKLRKPRPEMKGRKSDPAPIFPGSAGWA